MPPLFTLALCGILLYALLSMTFLGHQILGLALRSKPRECRVRLFRGILYGSFVPNLYGRLATRVGLDVHDKEKEGACAKTAEQIGKGRLRRGRA